MMIYGQTGRPTELAFSAAGSYGDIFNQVQVDVLFRAPSGAEYKVPAFWAGSNVFRARHASAEAGIHTYRTLCSNPDDAGLHDQTGQVSLAADPHVPQVYRRGRVQVAAGGRTLQTADGAPFFWLADTWWYGMCSRLDWPWGMRELTLDRAGKGFTVIQVVVGMPCDIDSETMPFDPQYGNEGGLPWEEGWARINPAYFDMVDLRIAYLLEAGLVPCIVGSWGYFLSALGPEKMRQHWRNLVARYAAFPVVWCLAGEVTLPTYSRAFGPNGFGAVRGEMQQLSAGWTEMGRYVKSIDPYTNPVTAHPFPGTSMSGRGSLVDGDVLDLDLLQTGHTAYEGLERSLQAVAAAVGATPSMPVINGEVNYEGILGGNGAELQRFAFYTCMAQGTAGHTYGANGVWQMNSRRHPPHRGYTACWGEGVWQDAMYWPGSGQVGLGKRLFERYPWPAFTPRAEPALPANRLSAYATGIPGAVAIYYLPPGAIAGKFFGVTPGLYFGPGAVVTVEPDAHYRAFYYDPRHGDEVSLGEVAANGAGRWVAPPKPNMEDWVLVLEDRAALERL